ncbi:MAG: hypothetical protein QG594_34 [Bacteroidota bacterium]|nr:hypothetical protein [Bacteroidota bacterium]
MENSQFLNKFCIMLITTFLCLQSIAQEPIQTDRPDQTEGVFIVPKHYLQIESGLNIEKKMTIQIRFYCQQTLLNMVY